MFEPTISLPRDRLRFNGRSDHGQWFNSFRDVFLDLTASVQELFHDPVKVAMELDPGFTVNRALRRKVKQKSSPKLMSKHFTRELPALWPNFIERARGEFPLSDETSTFWQQHLIGRAPVEDVSRSLAHDLSDLPKLMHWLKPSGGPHLRDMPDWLRVSADRYKSTIADAWARRGNEGKTLAAILGKDKLQTLWNGSRESGLESFKETLRNAVRKIILEETNYIQELGLEQEALNAFVDANWMEAFPTQRVLAEAYIGIFEKNISPFEQPRKLEKVSSDVGDIMHALYMPYVDIFRVDGFACQYLRTASALVNTELVDKLEKLAPAIRKRLSEQRK